MRIRASLSFLALLLAWGAPASAQSLDVDADVIYLRKDCTGYPADRCLQDGATPSSNLTWLAVDKQIAGDGGWIWKNWWSLTSKDALIVEIGPGDFTGHILCPSGKGSVTFRGAGRGISRILGDGFVVDYAFAVKGVGCTSIAFEDLTLVARSAGGKGHAVYWQSGGRSSWTRVDLEGDSYAWYETQDCS
jgi:hypothetical protein